MAGNNLTISQARTDPITHNPATALTVDQVTGGVVTAGTAGSVQARQTASARHEMYEDSGGAGGETKIILDPLGVTAVIGRGDTDLDITYIQLFNANATPCYIYPNGAGNGIIVTTVKP